MDGAEGDVTTQVKLRDDPSSMCRSLGPRISTLRCPLGKCEPGREREWGLVFWTTNSILQEKGEKECGKDGGKYICISFLLSHTHTRTQELVSYNKSLHGHRNQIKRTYVSVSELLHKNTPHCCRGTERITQKLLTSLVMCLARSGAPLPSQYTIYSHHPTVSALAFHIQVMLVPIPFCTFIFRE